MDIQTFIENLNVNNSIFNQSFASIKTEVNNILQQLSLTKTELSTLNKKLKNYRYIDDIENINIGGYIRWIQLKDVDDIKLKNGGLVCDINMKNGIILCKNFYNKFFNVSVKHSVVFQKLSNDEILLLKAIKYMS